MNILVAKTCGYCKGVKNAIKLAEEVLKERKDVYSLGPLIHNPDAVNRLAEKGLKTVSNLEQIESGVVLIRSHGADPHQIARIRKKGLKIADATCVLVKRVQEIACKLSDAGYKVVVIGDKKHPEVRAVVGSAEDVYVVADQADLKFLPGNSRLGIVCQTTQSPQYFAEMIGAIANSDFQELKVVNTLCKEAVKRQKSAVQLCKTVDVMFVLGGLESANTRKLAELCKNYNEQTFHLQNWSEFDKKFVLGKKTAGITAGASTPQWIIEQFVQNLKAWDST